MNDFWNIGSYLYISGKIIHSKYALFYLSLTDYLSKNGVHLRFLISIPSEKSSISRVQREKRIGSSIYLNLSFPYYNSVPISGLLIDTLAYRFLTDWANRDKSYLYYDWMSRDFFAYLKNQDSTQTTWYAIGSAQSIYNPDNFRYKATVAYNKTLEAIQQETDGNTWSSKQKWREIYGTRFPD